MLTVGKEFWKRIYRLQFFSEENDTGQGPWWAKVLFVWSVVISFLSVTLGVLALFAENYYYAGKIGVISIASFSLCCAAAWHLGMPGRAKNGLVLVLMLTAMLWLVFLGK